MDTKLLAALNVLRLVRITTGRSQRTCPSVAYESAPVDESLHEVLCGSHIAASVVAHVDDERGTVGFGKTQQRHVEGALRYAARHGADTHVAYGVVQHFIAQRAGLRVVETEIVLFYEAVVIVLGIVAPPFAVV